MKQLLCLLLALLLAGCTAAPAETEPVEVTGNIKLIYQENQVQVDCNGQTLEFGAVHGIAQDGYLDCAKLTVLGEQALLITFGESRFLFLGNLTREEQLALLEEKTLPTVGVLQLYGEPAQELLAAVAPVYVMTPEKSQEGWTGEVEHFSYEGFGPVTAESDGTGINLSWMLHISHDVASAGN